LEDEIIKTDATKSFVHYEPLGVVLAVMPWNFPFWQVMRCAAPTLMAGNAMVLKHASNVSGCSLAIEEVFKQAEFPEGLFRSILIPGSKVGDVIDHPLVQAVTLTGSTEAGKSIAARAGAALKKTVLELGGSDPYIVLEDADLEASATTCVTSRMINGGQSCVSAKRFIVVDSVLSAFAEKFVAKMKEQRMGIPTERGVTLGPLARHDLRDQLHQFVQDSVAMGAQLLMGGQIPENPGAFYPPTVLIKVTSQMPVYKQELFGPVAVILKAKDEAEAITMANDSIFGLGAAVFTSNVKNGERIAAEELEAGCCFVNDFVKSDPRLPFGGIKQSGYGRELSHFGIREFVNVKSVSVK
jgi:succinate-semialdehyde dehydrogenase/glutarate-semialdehyde dehydrogenase